MKIMQLSQLQYCYSLIQADKPAEVWAVSVIKQPELEEVQGIPEHVLEKALSLSKEWTGWGFLDSQAWLFFKNKEDAVLASLCFGEGNNG